MITCFRHRRPEKHWYAHFLAISIFAPFCVFHRWCKFEVLFNQCRCRFTSMIYFWFLDLTCCKFRVSWSDLDRLARREKRTEFCLTAWIWHARRECWKHAQFSVRHSKFLVNFELSSCAPQAERSNSSSKSARWLLQKTSPAKGSCPCAVLHACACGSLLSKGLRFSWRHLRRALCLRTLSTVGSNLWSEEEYQHNELCMRFSSRCPVRVVFEQPDRKKIVKSHHTGWSRWQTAKPPSSRGQRRGRASWKDKQLSRARGTKRALVVSKLTLEDG